MTSPPAMLKPKGDRGMNESTVSDLQQAINKVLLILKQRRWLFIIPVLGGTIIALIVSLFIPREYVLHTIFERRDDPVISNLIRSNSPYSFDTLRKSLGLDLKGREALRKAIHDLEFTKNLPRDADGNLTAKGRAKEQKLLVKFSKEIDVRLKSQSPNLDLIEIRYEGDSPALGSQMVKQLRNNYIELIRRRIVEMLYASHNFFLQEAQNHQAKVDELEKEYLRLLVQHPEANPNDPDRLKQQIMREELIIDNLKNNKNETKLKITANEELLQELNDPHSAQKAANSLHQQLPSANRANPEYVRLSNEIKNVQQQIADSKALRGMKDAHPTVVSLRLKLDQLRSDIKSVPPTISSQSPGIAANISTSHNNDPYAAEKRRIEMELKSNRNILEKINRDLARHETIYARLQEEKSTLFEKQQEYLDRQNKLQQAKTDLTYWQRHVKTLESRLAAESKDHGIQFATIEEARCPSKPRTPTLAGVFLLSIGTGLALGTTIVFLREIFDRTLRDPTRIREILGIPVLETIGEISMKTPHRWFNRRKLLPLLATVQVILVIGMSMLVYLNFEMPDIYDHLIQKSIRIWPALAARITELGFIS